MENEKVIISDAKLVEYLDLFGYKDIPENEKTQFIEICKMANLNPFAREAHISAYGKGEYRKFAVITGYETYIRRAEESGRLEGWQSPIIEECKTAKIDLQGKIGFIEDIKATISINRKGFIEPFHHSVKLYEFVKKKKDGTVTEFWLKPEMMLKKVCIAQGFRLCFPDVLKYLPYAKEEYDNSIVDITNQQNYSQNEVPPKLITLKNGVSQPTIDNTIEPPRGLPSLIPKTEKWSEAINFILKGVDTKKEIQKIKLKYYLSLENEELLIEQATEVLAAQKA